MRRKWNRWVGKEKVLEMELAKIFVSIFHKRNYIDWWAWLPRISHKSLSSVVMGGSIFFFVESKTFEFSVKEGGTYFMLRIFEQSRDSLRSVFMGRESAKCLLAIVEDLMSTKTPSNFARTFRDNEKVFILQLGSNSHGSFLMILELIHGRQKGLLVVP